MYTWCTSYVPKTDFILASKCLSDKRHQCVILTFNIRLKVFTKISGQRLKINRLLTDQVWAHQYVISMDPVNFKKLFLFGKTSDRHAAYLFGISRQFWTKSASVYSNFFFKIFWALTNFVRANFYFA